MERCSLCGTPLGYEDDACSYCQHPVIARKRPETEPTSSAFRPVLLYIIILFVLMISSLFWYMTKDASSSEVVPSPVQTWSLSEWSDEQVAYNQTYSKNKPPTSYDVLRFVRQYTGTVPELITFSTRYDSIETFSSIQYMSSRAFKSELQALTALRQKATSAAPPRIHTVEFQDFSSDGSIYELRTLETYQTTQGNEPSFVTYRVQYRIQLHTDHLQITHTTRTEVKT